MSKDKTIYIGTSGWSYDHWVNKFYPEDLKKNEWLSYYAEQFNTVELNMSFYQFPFPNMLKGWYKKIPDQFQMTMKANRNITHRRQFKDTDELVNRFYQRAEFMEDKMGCILYQTPPTFKYEEETVKQLTSFFKTLDHDYMNVMEFRHPDWWNEEVYELLKDHQIGFCVVSGLDMPQEVRVTADVAYFRFHGPGEGYASKYSESDIQQWRDKIKSVLEDVDRVYCYFNNDMEGYAVENARYLQQLLE
ncbi:MAG: DUF72 domain-containing protein [Fidelibacterota bacterium]